MKILKYLYTGWCLLVLVVAFLLCVPSFYICLLSPKLHKGVHFTNRVWAVLTFTLCGLRLEKKYHFDKKQLKSPAVYCANHTSYLDIPMVFLTVPGFFSIIGKAELGKVVLFGRMFRNVYITVNRKSGHSRKESYDKSVNAIKKGRSMVFYPEGTIPKNAPPSLGVFKDGAFRLAIDQQIPIVPITFPFNWIILPENLNTLVTPHKAKIVYHEPIETKGMTLDDVPALKQQVYDVINNELKQYFDI